jgi:hypothetical protein
MGESPKAEWSEGLPGGRARYLRGPCEKQAGDQTWSIIEDRALIPLRQAESPSPQRDSSVEGDGGDFRRAVESRVDVNGSYSARGVNLGVPDSV